MTQPTRSQVTRPLVRAGHEQAKWRTRRVGGAYSPGFRVEVFKHFPCAWVHHEVGYVSVAGHSPEQLPAARMAALVKYAETLRAAGLNVTVDERSRRLEVTRPE